MNIELVGKDLHPSDMLKDRLEHKLGKIESRLGQPLFVRVKLDQQGQDYSCTVRFNGARHEFTAIGTGKDLVKAADDSLAKIERQVRKAQHKSEAGRGSSIRDAIPLEADDLDDSDIAEA